MVVKRKKKRAVKPKDLPSRYFKSKSGRIYAYLIVVTERDWREEQLYKLQSLMHDHVNPRTGEVRHISASDKLWTKGDLLEAGRFLRNAPTKAMIETAKAIPLP